MAGSLVGRPAHLSHRWRSPDEATSVGILHHSHGRIRIALLRRPALAPSLGQPSPARTPAPTSNPRTACVRDSLDQPEHSVMAGTGGDRPGPRIGTSTCGTHDGAFVTRAIPSTSPGAPSASGRKKSSRQELRTVRKPTSGFSIVDGTQVGGSASASSANAMRVSRR